MSLIPSATVCKTVTLLAFAPKTKNVQATLLPHFLAAPCYGHKGLSALSTGHRLPPIKASLSTARSGLEDGLSLCMLSTWGEVVAGFHWNLGFCHQASVQK